MKRTVTFSLFTILVAIVGLFSASPLRAQSSRGLELEIDAAYMKEHIYDYEQHPSSFVYKGDKPAIIDFYADWCGPCRSLGPKLSAEVKKHQGKVILYKINVDENKELAALFGIQSIPTVLFVPLEGKPYLSQGNLPKKSIEKMVAKIL